MADKIKLWELVEKVQSGTLSRADAQKFFVEDRLTSQPFAPRFKINEATVAANGLEAASAAMSSELLRATDEQHQLAAADELVPPDGSIVAEGDSWFDLPSIWPKTLVDFLQKTFPINNIAHWGDTLEDMIAKGQYVSFLKDKKTKALLISGGGNDIVDIIGSLLRLYDTGHTKPKDALYYILPHFFEVLKNVEDMYKELLGQVQKYSPATVVVVHGYDYAIPGIDGTWLGRPMQDRGLQPQFDGPLCNAIIRVIIDRVNERLSALADASGGKLRYVNLRGTVRDDRGEWFDELHAREAATKRMAAKFAPVLKQIIAA